MKYLEAVNKFLNDFLMVLGGIAILGLMVLATGNVVLRMLHIPFRGTYEIVSFLGACVIAFALGYTQATKSNIVVDILSEKFPPALANMLDRVVHLVIMVFFGIVAWQVYVYAMKLVESHEVSETLKVIYYPFVFCVALGFAVLALTGLVDFVKTMFREGDKI
jgi:TRAP-type C4-dicarboxylate transport system permease small subunit